MPSFTNVVKKGTPFEPEAGRYVLYASLFCPFAGRVLVMRKLKGLEDIVPVVYVNTVMNDSRRSWSFKKVVYPDRPHLGIPGTVPEPLYNLQDLRELYEKHSKGAEVEPPFPVPTLWDKKQERIVSNESNEMLRWFQTAFDDLLPPEKAGRHYYPSELAKQIDEVYEWGQRDLATGVYKAGFATDQEGYDKGVRPVFSALDRLEALVKKNGGPFVFGDTLTETDVWMYTCLVRFDVVYHHLFKCSFRSVRGDYPHLHCWLRNLYWNHEEFKSVTDFDNIKSNYYSGSSRTAHCNPSRIIPFGPEHPVLPLDDDDKAAGAKAI